MSPLKKPRLVVFDMDGTLLDTTATIVDCWKQALDRCGLRVPTDHELRSRVGQAIVTALPSLLPESGEEDLERFIEVYREVYIAAVTATPPPLFPGIRGLLDTLKAQGIPTGIATSKSRAGLDRTLAADHLEEWFPPILRASADDGPSKPHPKMLLDLLERSWHEAEDAIMVGDTTFDLRMAQAAGVRGVAVTCGAHDREILEDAGPVAILAATAQLPTLWE